MPELEYRFDGFDVLGLLRESGRSAPVVFAGQGLRIEQDYIDEIPAHAEVAGLLYKSAGLGPIVTALRLAGHGRRLPERDFPPGARTDGSTCTATSRPDAGAPQPAGSPARSPAAGRATPGPCRPRPASR